MKSLPWIALGGAVGAAARYVLIISTANILSNNFPWATLIVNLLGSLLIGYLGGLIMRYHVSEQVKNFIFIGLLGSFTTFSTYALESVELMRNMDIAKGFYYIALHNITGVLLVISGYYLAEKPAIKLR